MYVRNHFHKDAKDVVLEISKYVREVVLTKLKFIDWMDQKTRRRALQKAKNMSECMAYPEELLNDEILERTYGKVS